MAQILGGVAVSHVPAIGNAIARGLQQDPYWKPFFDGLTPVRSWLAEVKPDIAVMFYNDHGLNFFLDKMPTFAVGAAAQHTSADEGWGLPVVPPFTGAVDLSWHIIETLVASEFDVTMCQEMLVDHAFVNPMELMWPGHQRHIKVVPIAINTVQHPLPSALRCFKLGQAVGAALQSFDADARVVVLGTGGMSHQLDGTRAGFINKDFDRLCLEKIGPEPEVLTAYSVRDLIDLSGAQGIEILNWIAMRGALIGQVTKRHENYHIPISNTASGLVLLENA